MRIIHSMLPILLLVSPGFSQEKGNAAPPMDENTRKWMEAAAPNENHKKLGAFVGSWDAETRFWVDGPGKPPTVTKGTGEVSWAFDGRFIRMDFKGEMIGQPMTGIGFNGYDNLNKKYTQFWIDNTATAMFTAEGSFDPSGKVMTLFGKMDDPLSGEHDKNVKYISRVIDKDKYVFEIHDMGLDEMNSMVAEITYTRKK